MIPEGAKRYPAVLHVLVDPVKRAKLQAVCDSMNVEIHTFEGRKLNLLGEVRYGIFGPTLTVCAQWLKATEAAS